MHRTRIDRRTRGLLAVVGLALAACPAPAWAGQPQPVAPGPVVQPVTDELVGQAINRGIEYLWSKMNPTEFHWEPQTMAEWEKWVKANPDNKNNLTIGGMHGGFTALTLMALVRAGVSPDDERFARSLKWLIDQPMNQTYPRAMRAALLATLLAHKPECRKTLEDDKKWLLEAIFIDGTYGYFAPADNKVRMTPGGAYRDLSNTQYGHLGMWLLSDAGLEAPEKYWKLVQNCWITQQNTDGSWPYYVVAKAGANPPSQTMALAGVASLFVAWDKTCPACNVQPEKDMVDAIDKGLAWLGKNFNPALGGATVFTNQFQMYGLYGVERVGVASGMKYFGEHNWYIEAARYALARQQKDGSWPADYGSFSEPPVSTSYGLLFLSFGRAPVVFNKLAYGSTAQWNTRPRDLARLSVWLNKVTERLYNWQIMPIEKPVEELLDAPILLMSGRTAIQLTREQKLKLKDYVLGGGLLLGESADGSKAFADSFRAMIRELFGELEMKPLSDTHLIYTSQYKLKPPGTPGGAPPLEGLSNGVRTMVLLSTKDLGCAWQQFKFKTDQPHFELAGNLVDYVSDRGKGLLGRGASYMARDLGNKPPRQVTVGRLVWGGRYNWDPEPAGWPRMDVLLRNRNLAGVSTTQCDLSAPVDPQAVPILHVTGTTTFQLTDAQKANLKKYIADGGTLLADPAGGGPASARFTESFTKLASELFGPLTPANPPWLDDATDKGETWIRHIGGLPRALRKLQLLGAQHGGRWAVVLLPYDLTAAMAGYPNIEPVGLMPASAEKFVAALIKGTMDK